MALLTKMKYSFTSRGMDEETFTVVSFKGFEAISKPYEFEILLVSDKTDIDPLDVLKNPAVFTIHRDREDNVDFNGILIRFEETMEFDGYLFFKAVLAPKLWWLTLTHHNQVFLNMTIPQIMESALKDGGLFSGKDFDFPLNPENTYSELEYVCQYDESHLNFVSRWAEREGIYYYFEQTFSGEKIIFTDTKIRHIDLTLGKDLVYEPPSGLAATHTKEVIHSFVCRHNMLPGRVYLKDYNYMKPSQTMEGFADVDENGRGENYIYGVNFDSVKEGNRLAQIRADALLCRKSVFTGESAVPFMVPGYTFDLNRHYKNSYNRKYLVTDVMHEGHQTGYLISGLSAAVQPRDEEMFYANTFTAIYSDFQFRPEHVSEKPKISGTINAKIDAAGSGKHAELDKEGRYKVILPFDRSGRFGGKASAWFRMMQPSAGNNQGMHFPLHKGSEVLLTFIEGDPDRPVIAGAVPNPETSSPVTAGNQTKSIITTGKDKPEPTAGAKWGQGKDDEDEPVWTDDPEKSYLEFDNENLGRIRINSPGDLWFEARKQFTNYQIGVPDTDEDRPEHVKDLIDKMYKFDGSDFAPTGVELHKDESPYKDSPTGEDPAPEFPSSDDKDKEKWQYLVKRGKVTIAKGDTFNTQEGNIYDFGGYWNYNLGNSYVEEHLDQSAELNKTRALDLMDQGGPGWTEVDWSKAETKDKDDIKIKSSIDWTNTGKGVWVEKQFGHAYNYTEGDSIEVTKGSSLEIQHGGEHIELVFRDNKDDPDEPGAIKSWSWSKGAKSEEKKWLSDGKKIFESSKDRFDSTEKQYDATTGLIITHSGKSNRGGTIASLDFGFCAKASSSFEFGVASSFSLSASGSLEVNIEFVASVEIEAGLGTGLEIDYRKGGTAKLEHDGLQFDAIGITARKEAAVKAKKAAIEAESKEIILDNILTQLSKNSAKIEKNSIDIATNELRMQMGFELAGL